VTIFPVSVSASAIIGAGVSYSTKMSLEGVSVVITVDVIVFVDISVEVVEVAVTTSVSVLVDTSVEVDVVTSSKDDVAVVSTVLVDVDVSTFPTSTTSGVSGVRSTTTTSGVTDSSILEKTISCIGDNTSSAFAFITPMKKGILFLTLANILATRLFFAVQEFVLTLLCQFIF
jgi:hypothetical protein